MKVHVGISTKDHTVRLAIPDHVLIVLWLAIINRVVIMVIG